MTSKRGVTTNFSPLSFVAVFGSRIRDPDGKKSVSGIRDTHPGSATLVARTDIRKQSFAVRAVEKWNRLPELGQGRGEKPDYFKRQLKKAMA